LSFPCLALMLLTALRTAIAVGATVTPHQVLSLGPHLVAAKLMRRIFLLEPFHTLHASTRGEEIAYGKMLDPEGAAKFVGTAVAADEFGRCAGGGVPVAPRKAGGGGGGAHPVRHSVRENSLVNQGHEHTFKPATTGLKKREVIRRILEDADI